MVKIAKVGLGGARTDDVSKCDWITDKQGQLHYQMSRAGFVKLSEQAGARCKFGKRARSNKSMIDMYLLNECR